VSQAVGSLPKSQLNDRADDYDCLTPPECQISNLDNWHHASGGHIMGDDLLVAIHGRAVPEPDQSRARVALTLCWTLGTLWETITAKLEIMRALYVTSRPTISSL
jgi:hypothetical protein